MSDDGLDPWVVLYREADSKTLRAFTCRAEEGDSAEAQFLNLHPDCDVVWTYLGDTDEAFKDYDRFAGLYPNN